MDFDEKRVLELFLGLIFVALLIIISILIIYYPGSEFQKTNPSTNVVLNSYNLNSFNNIDNLEKTNYRNYDKIYEKPIEIKSSLDYYSYGNHFKEKTIFNNYRDEFNVYVVNKDYEGGYFEVKFTFCDYYGNCFSESITKYVSSKDKVKFVYLDLQIEKYKYNTWKYVVFSPKTAK